jgi:hypothetical protein
MLANEFAKMGGLWRLLGVLCSLVIGGACIGLGHILVFEGFTTTELRGSDIYQVTRTFPVAGWIGMVAGGIIALLGSWTALVATKEGIQMREEMERLEEEEMERLEEEERKRHQDS